MNSRVSIVIPAYKAAGTLERTVISCLSQTFPSDILIVVNGNDKTLEVALELKLRFSTFPITVVYPGSETLPAAENWTRAISTPNSEYIKLLCADDVLDQDAIKKQVEFLDSHPHLAFVGARRRVVDLQNRVLLNGVGGSRLPKKFSGLELLSSCISRGTNTVGEPSAVLFRTSVIKKFLPWDGSHPYVIDLDMYFRILSERNSYGGFIDEVLCSFTISKQAWSTELSKRQASDFIFITDLYCTMYGFGIFSKICLRLSSHFNQFARKIFYLRL
jgi:glycosyltransferase involved in cell wall biosynthesis